MHKQLRQRSNLVRNRALVTLTGVPEMIWLDCLAGQTRPNRALRRSRGRAMSSTCTAIRASHTPRDTISQELGARISRLPPIAVASSASSCGETAEGAASTIVVSQPYRAFRSQERG